MAQPVVPTTNKLRIKLKGVPRVQQSAAAIYKGPAQAVRASLQLQDFRAAVDAFSKQGVHGLPDGMLLDPWNQEAELQAQQEINPTLTAVQYPPSAARVRKRRAPGPAEICLADLGPDYVVWGRHKRQRSEQPKRLAKSPSQLSSSLQRMLASSSQPRTNSSQPRTNSSQPRTNSAQQGAPAAAAAKGATSQQQQQRNSLVQIPPRPPSPCLDDPMEWQPPVPPVDTSPAAAAPAQQERRAPEEAKQRQQLSAVEQPPRPAPEQPSAAAVPQKRKPQQPQGAPAAVESKQPQPQPAAPREQPPAQQEELQVARAADKQSPAQPCTAEPSVQQEQAQQSEYTDGIATRLRRRAAPEQLEASNAQQQSKQQKQAKGKQKQQKQRAEASQDSGPPAKKVRAGEGAQEPAASEAAADSAPPAKPPAKSAAAKAAAAAEAPKSAAPQAADRQVPVNAPAAPAKASRGKAAAVKAAASPVKPAAAGKAGAAAKAAPASKDAAGAAAKEAQAAEAAAAAHEAGARGPAAAVAAVQATKPESPPSETSHQQPIVTAMPQHLQLQPPLVPQLLQEQTAVSRDRSQCSLQQPVESPAAVASAGGRLGGAGAAAGAGPGGVARTAAGAGLAAAMRQPKRHLLELDASAMTPAALALGSLVVPPVTFRPVLPTTPFPDQEAAVQHLDGMIMEARNKKHKGDKRMGQERCWDVQSITSYACSVLEFLRYWDACHKALKQLSEAGKPTEVLKKRITHITRSQPGLLKQVSQLATNALQSASNCRGQDVQKQALRMLLERLTAICQLRHLHSQREALSQQVNILKGAAPVPSSSRPQQQQQQVQRTGAGRPPVRASVAAAAAAAGSSSPRGKQAFNKRSPDDSNTSHEDRVQMPHALEQHSPGLLHHGGSPGAGGNGAAAGGGAGAERALIVAESTCSEHLSELLKVTDGMHQTVMRMQQFLESPDVLADANARSAALHISTLGLDAGMFSIPRVVAHAEAALVCIVRSGRLDMARTAS